MFEIFPWNSNLETGIDLIDEQHHKLVDLINRLAQQHVQGATEAEVQAILGELGDYADYHFRTEEAIWQTALAGDDWLTRHIETHQRFFAHMVEMQSGQRPFQAVLDDLFSYLIQWLAYHILDNDKRMALALKAVEQGASIEAAHAEADAHMQGATATLIQTVLGMYQTLSSQALILMHEKLARQRAEKALAESEARWRLLLEHTTDAQHTGSRFEKTLSKIIDELPAGLAVVDPDSRVYVFVNPWFCHMLGYTREELLALGPQDIHPPQCWAEVDLALRTAHLQQKRAALIIPVTRQDGSHFLASIEHTAIELDGRLSSMAIFTDVTEREAARSALEAERLRLQNAIDAVQAGTWEFDLISQTVRYDDRFARMLGYDNRGPMSGAYAMYVSWMHPDDRAAQQLQMDRHLRGDTPRFEVELRLRHKDGHWVWCHTLGRVMQRDERHAPLRVAGISVDISEQKTHRAQLDHITHHDALTGLPNRKLFVQTLTQAMRAATDAHHVLAVTYLDLDGLSAINDRHGSEVGNQLVLEISRRLRQLIHPHAHLAHIGGDEFAVILSPLDQPQAFEAPVKALLERVSAPMSLHGLMLQVTASMGITLFPQLDKIDAEQLLRQADQAMYLAKLAGKNRAHLFDPINDETTRAQFMRIDEIRRGLLKNEFVLHYQPKVHLSSGVVLGFEALIRWQHPSLGLLLPGLFIPALNQHPMAITLGNWVIDIALAQLAQWNALGIFTTVSVNIDSLQLHDPDFADRLQRQLNAQPTVQAKQLELEILETGALENMAHVSVLVNQLQRMGFECALDDFGTGYSSLTFLKQLQAHTIKIDQSFVRGMLDDAQHAAIVNSVLDLARNFARRPLAEGVETEAHGLALIELGCEFGQGYAIAHAMPADTVPLWLSQWQLPASWVRNTAT
ncbi:MAG: signal transduction protein [Comamonadaceae bacterium]|nr:MAG: signal transduction protein [Comamonadaceae bacterium]